MANDKLSRCFEVILNRILETGKLSCCVAALWSMMWEESTSPPKAWVLNHIFFPFHNIRTHCLSFQCLNLQTAWARNRPHLCVPTRRTAGKMKPTVSSRLVYWAASLNAVRSQNTCHQALSLTVGNVTLANGQIARGAVVGVGTPSQPMAFLPQM